MFRASAVLLLTGSLLLAGCRASSPPAATPPPSTLPSPQRAAAANRAFLEQKRFDPWLLTNTSEDTNMPAYLGNGKEGWLIDAHGRTVSAWKAGVYRGGQLQPQAAPPPLLAATPLGEQPKTGQTLDLRTGTLTTNGVAYTVPDAPDFPKLWQMADVLIDGDPRAQQVIHANLFYLLSSTSPGSDHSIPPLGLSSGGYGGHVFWDADVWMLPALIVQHPAWARSIVDYRFRRLGQARKNAARHHFQGAEFPWESADTGEEVAPAEFAQERHVTADVAFAAWQYYLWTGDRAYLAREGGPLLDATARYWASRVTRGADGRFHIRGVLSPDETAGVVDDDAWTNGAVAANLTAATAAAHLLGKPSDPAWKTIATNLARPFDRALQIPQENAGPLTDRFAAKQADTLLLLHPLGVPFDPATAGRMLDFYAAHTIKTGPAMTDSIQAVVAARLGRAAQSRAAFEAGYSPFLRAPWDAFSEKRTTNNVYFLTGMAGCVQSVLYGFAGLQVYAGHGPRTGTRIAGDGEASLYADPHLPPGWKRVVIQGIRFRGQTLDLTVLPGNTLQVAHHGSASPGRTMP